MGGDRSIWPVGMESFYVTHQALPHLLRRLRTGGAHSVPALLADTGSGYASGWDRRRPRPQQAGIDRGEHAAAAPTDRAASERPAPGHHRCGSRAPGAAGRPPPHLAPGAAHRPTRYPAALAPARLPSLLGLEVAPAGWQAASPGGNDRSHQGHGCRQSPLGCRAHPQRALEARDTDGQTHHPEVPAKRSSITTARADLVDLPPHPGQGHLGV